MKKIRNGKKGRVLALLMMRMLLAASALAVEPSGQEPNRLEQIHQVRMKQEDNENVVRIIQQPVQMFEGNLCLPVEMTRQRLREVGDAQETSTGTVNIQAGHGEVNVEGNEGTISNDVNVQVVTNDQRKCF